MKTITMKDYEETIYLNTNLTREEANNAAEYFWGKGLGMYEAIQSIRKGPRFEIIEKTGTGINGTEMAPFEGFWDAVQACIDLDRLVEEDIWVACYKNGMPYLIAKPKKEDEGISLHFENI